MNDTLRQTTQKLLSSALNATVMDSTTEALLNRLNPNQTLDVKNQSVKTQLALYDILIPTLGALIILLNFAVVISSGLILKKGQQPRSTYLFLGNVAMTDLVTGIAVVFGQVFPKSSRDHYVCSIQLGLIVSSTLTSVYSVGLIAIDRFLYILHGIQYQRWVYPTRARLLILATWIIGGIIGFMPLFGWHGDTDNGRICWFIFLAPRGLILLTVIAGIIPLLTVLVLYSVILFHAIKKIVQLQRATRDPRNQGESTSKNLRMFRGRGNADADPPVEKPQQKTLLARIFKKEPAPSVQAPSKWKAIKVVMFTTGSFVVTWCPYFIASIIYVYQCENNSSKKCKGLSIVIASPLAILGFANSLINPIIYAWWHKGFREFVQKRVSVVIMKARRASNAVTNNTNSTEKTTSRKESTTSSSAKNDRVLPEIIVEEEVNGKP